MAFIIKDRVKENTTTTGTGAVSLGGAAATFDTFQSYMVNGDTTYYAIVSTETNTDEWEVGLGTWNTGNTLTRTTVLAGSNGTNAVDLGSGNKDIFMTYPAAHAALAGDDVDFANITVSGTVDGRDVAADGTKLDTVEQNADVTDAVNVAAAGALMKSGGTMTGNLILNADPTTALGAATKEYVDTIAAAGIHYHTPVRVESPDTAGNLNATYDNGTSGVGATLTNAGTQAALVIDGVTLSTNDRVLIYNQTNGYENGIYTVTNTGSASTNWVLTRATDADSYAASDPDALGEGDAYFVKEGDTGAGELYVMNTSGVITFGTTAINFTVIAETAVYSAGTGITLTGTTFSIGQDVGTTANVTFNQVTAAIIGNVTGNVTGNVSGNAGTATKLSTARTIQLSGDVTGSASFDGSANINITAAVQDDSHAHVISNVDGLQTALDAKVPTTRTLTAGNGLTGGGDLSANRTFNVGAGSGITVSADAVAHADTSSQASVNNTGRTYIQDITLDGFGHVTGLTSATETVTNTNQLTTFVVEDGDGTEVTISHGKEWKFVEGGAIDINWTNTANGTDADPFDLTISHVDTSSQASVNNSNGTVIQDVTLDTYGHVTGLASLDGDARWVNVTGDTMTGNLTIDTNSGPLLKLQATNGSPWAIELGRDDSTNSKVYNQGGFWSFEHEPRYYNGGSPQKLFHDGYHPNADKWTTARTNTVTLTGDVTGSGSASVDGSGNWTVSIATDWQGGTANTTLNMNNSNITNVNHLTFNDPGPGEGLEWLGGSGWEIYESPNDLTTNSGGNLQFVTGTTRRMTLDTNGHLTLGGVLYPENQAVGYIGKAAGNYGTIRVVGNVGSSGGYAGYAISDDWVFMSSGPTISGIYNDTDNEWAAIFRQNAEVELFHNGVLAMETVGANGIRVGSTTSSDIYMQDTDHGERRIHCNSNRLGFLNSSSSWSFWSDDAGDIEAVYGANFGSATLTADGQNDVFMFATSATSATAQSGAFHNKLRILGGSSQTRDLQLWQEPSGYAHIGSSWTSNALYIDSSFTFTTFENPIYINTASDEKITLRGSSDPYIRFEEGTTDRAYIRWLAGNDALSFVNQQNDYFDFYTHDGAGAVNIRLRGSDGDVFGSVYADDNSDTGRIGFLDDDQNWAYRITSDASHEWMINASVKLNLTSTALTLDCGTSSTLNVKCDDAGLALIRANGDSQGTGAIEVGQSNLYGGGISYNGDGTPAFVSGETADHITFYRNEGNTRTKVFSYPYNSNTVTFNGSIVANNMYVDDVIYHNGDTDTYMQFNAADSYRIVTGGTERVTVNSTGVRVGNTNNGYFQGVAGNYGSIQIDGGAKGGYEGYSIGGRAVFMHNNSTTTGIYNDVDNEWLFTGSHNAASALYYNGSAKVTTTNTGVTITGDVNSTSDIRYKKNIETIDGALQKVKALRGVTFDWDNDAFEETELTKKPSFTERATGVIAQDVEKVLPEAVREDAETGFKNVSYGNMVGLLIEAIKEQQEQIDMLTQKLNEMENK